MIRVAPRTAAAAAALAALVLVGCTGGDGDDTAAEPTEAVTDGVGSATAQPTEAIPDTERTDDPVFPFADADVAYLQRMLPSHDQARAVAQLVLERTEREDFRQLATDSLAFREQQIATLTDLATQAEAEIDPADHAAAGDAPSVVPDADIAALEQAAPEAFDVAAAEVLARIDEGAVAVADETLEAAEHPDVIVAAIDTIDRVEPEAATLRTWIGQWGGG